MILMGGEEPPPRAPADHDGAVCATCRHAARPRLDPDRSFGWRCSAHPERRVREAWKDPITGVATPEEWEPAWCEHHNSRGECELYEVGEPREREYPKPTTGGPNGGSRSRGGDIGSGKPPETAPEPPDWSDEPRRDPLALRIVAFVGAVVASMLLGSTLTECGNATPPAEVDRP